jgi:hypothetical protein
MFKSLHSEIWDIFARYCFLSVGENKESSSAPSVVDPHHFDADPDSTYHPDAASDADPTFHPDEDPDPDPDPSFKKRLKPLKTAEIGSYFIHLA